MDAVDQNHNNFANRVELRPQQRRRALLKHSALIVILLPTLISAIYFGLFASDQYDVEMRFALRGANSSGGAELLGLVTGIQSSGSTTQDAYLLMDYLHSRALLEKLERTAPLTAIYGSQKADFFSSLAADESIEERVEYWRKMTGFGYDTSSQIISINIRAFTPEDAKNVAEEVLKLSETWINDLSAQARDDAVSFAEKDVADMEERLRTARQAVRAFREREQVIDPTKTAETRLTILGKLEGELSAERAKLSALSQFMSQDSPRIQILVGTIASLERTVQAERAKLAGSAEGVAGELGPLTEQLDDYRLLLTSQEFSEKAYITALSTLEASKIEARRRQRYLAIVLGPTLPEEALYPKRAWSVLTTLVVSFLAWAIGTLLVYAIRDHVT